MWRISLVIFVLTFLALFRFVGVQIALFFSVVLAMTFIRCYITFVGASRFINSLNSQTAVRFGHKNRLISYSGEILESEFCIVRFEPSLSACFIVEKELPNTDGCRYMRIKNSNKTPDLYDAIFDVFMPNTNYDTLKSLCELYGVSYQEEFRISDKVVSVPQEEEKEKEKPVPPVEEPTMPVLKVDLDEPQKVEKEPETKYNDEREVDL